MDNLFKYYINMTNVCNYVLYIYIIHNILYIKIFRVGSGTPGQPEPDPSFSGKKLPNPKYENTDPNSYFF